MNARIESTPAPWPRALAAALCALAAAGAQAQAPAPAPAPAPARPAATERQRTILLVLPREEQAIEAAFRDELRKRQVPVQLQVLQATGPLQNGPALIEQVRRLHPDLIYSWGTPTTLALAGAHDAAGGPFIRDIPIVFTEVTDPLGSRLLRQLDPPGRNVTGVSHVAPLPVQINALRSYRPMARLGYIANPKEPNTQLVLESLRKLSQTLKFEVVDETLPLDAAGNADPAALPAVIQRIAARKVDFLYIGPSTFLAFTHRDAVTQAALQARLPTFCATESVVRRAKCMVGLFANGSNLGRFAAYKAAQILEGTPVERVPAESLRRFSLLINMPVARELKLYPPLPLLDAAEVIEN